MALNKATLLDILPVGRSEPEPKTPDPVPEEDEDPPKDTNQREEAKDTPPLSPEETKGRT